MKKFLLIIFTTLLFLFVQAQVPPTDDAYFYIKAGEELTQKTYIMIFKFTNNKIYAYTLGYTPKHEVTKNLASNPLYYYNLSYRHNLKDRYHYCGEYVSEMSTNKYFVYRENPDCPRCHTKYWAVSLDAQTIIQWYETPEGEPSGGEGEKKHFIRIPKQDLLPKTVNRDFLYD